MSSEPVSVSRKAVFVINSPKLRSLDDVKADDSGSWIHKGRPFVTTVLVVQQMGPCMVPISVIVCQMRILIL